MIIPLLYLFRLTPLAYNEYIQPVTRSLESSRISDINKKTKPFAVQLLITFGQVPGNVLPFTNTINIVLCALRERVGRVQTYLRYFGRKYIYR